MYSILGEGTDLRYIQELLEYNSSKTIEIHAYISKQTINRIKNPADVFLNGRN